jgi:ketosteroid isomerase-like protein
MRLPTVLTRSFLLLVLLTFGFGLPARAAEPAAQALYTKFLQAWQSGDADVFAACLHPDLVFKYPGGVLGKAELIQTFKTYQTEKQDIKIYFADFFVSEGARHYTAYQFAATDKATGKRFAVGTGVAGEIKDGLIVAFREYWDSEVAQRQKAGELPLDEGDVLPWPSSVWLRFDTID